nr:MAG TPA: hypothetical protein [Microviridae sp.]
MTSNGRISSYMSPGSFRHTTASRCAFTANALMC